MTTIIKLRFGLSSLLAFGILLQAFAGVTHAEIKVGLVLDKGGRDDKSFNASAYQGAMTVQKQLNGTIKYVEATDDNAFEPLLRSFAKKKFDLIIAVGVAQEDALRKVAARFPEQKFAIVDGLVEAPNVRSLAFQEHEGSYLVGVIAGLTTKTDKIGFIGGMDVPLIRRFGTGFSAGAKSVNPKLQVVSNYIGITADAWNNPTKAKELGRIQYGAGADIIFAAAGASGIGVFDAAEELKKLVIGVDSNQNWIKPGYVLTSMVKRVDIAVFETCKDILENHFTAGTKRYGLANNGVDFTVDEYNSKLISQKIRTKVNEIKAGIVAGSIKVPDSYQAKK